MHSTLKYTIIAMATLALSLGAACSEDDTTVTAEETSVGSEAIVATDAEATEEVVEETSEVVEQTASSETVN